MKRRGKNKDMFVARQSNHIQQDLARQWSSWNFGQEGFVGTREELNAYLALATEEDCVSVSMLDLYRSDLRNTQFGELHENYWVVIDERFNCSLAVNILPCETLESAIDFAESNQGFCGGDGDRVDTTGAVVVYSNGDLHILEIEE